MTQRLLLATRSGHKLGELRALLDLGPDVELLSPDDAGVRGDPVEDSETFEGNALIKARYFAERAELPVIADDSGLEVDALRGGPGVRTRRYAGEDASDSDNNAKLLRALTGLPPPGRTARYRCVLVYLERPESEPLITSGTFEGRIALAPRGHGGFGYDPIFEPATEPPGGRTVGELSAEEKNSVSHRAIAARAMGELLRGRS
ncbi:MAG: non-canonical purine NTP pyrophosphatase [Chloroflexi bacterium]|nr:non-canonical purine NTP pyrophosphatase [Chloroflexota bacterium]